MGTAALGRHEQAGQGDMGTRGRGPTFGSLAQSPSRTSQTHPPCRVGSRSHCPLCRPCLCVARPGSLTPAAQLTPPGHCLEGEWPTLVLHSSHKQTVSTVWTKRSILQNSSDPFCKTCLEKLKAKLESTTPDFSAVATL